MGNGTQDSFVADIQSAARQDFGLEHHPKGLRPRLGRILEVAEQANRRDRRPQALSSQRPAQGEVPANVLHQPLRLAQQDGIAGQAEDEIGIAVGNDQLHQFGVGEMAVAAQQDMGVRPVLPQQAQHALHDHRVLRAGRTLAGAQYGGYQGAGVGLEYQQRQVAMVAVMVVVKGKRLLTVERAVVSFFAAAACCAGSFTVVLGLMVLGLRVVDVVFMSVSRFIRRDRRGGESVTLFALNTSSHLWKKTIAQQRSIASIAAHLAMWIATLTILCE